MRMTYILRWQTFLKLYAAFYLFSINSLRTEKTYKQNSCGVCAVYRTIYQSVNIENMRKSFTVMNLVVLLHAFAFVKENVIYLGLIDSIKF